MEPLYAAISAWLTAITGLQAILAGQNAPAPAAPYISYRLSVSAEEAHEIDYPAGDDNARLARWATGTLAVQVTGVAGNPGAVDEASLVIAERILDNETAIDMLGRSFAVRRILSGPSDISVLDGSGLLPRVSLDIEIGFARESVHAVGRIETVDYTAAIGSTEIAGTLP